MSYQSFDQSSVQRMNRCTGPAPCQCPITGPHRADSRYCSRNAGMPPAPCPSYSRCTYPDCGHFLDVTPGTALPQGGRDA